MTSIYKQLPNDIKIIIFEYLIPDISKISFDNYKPWSSRVHYHPRYQIAYLNGNKIINKDKQFLSRISKPNGKHRYYFTTEYIDSIEIEYNDREHVIFQYDYSSSFVGKDLQYALLLLQA